MKTRPILFSAPMIRAILDGRKTQTRRILKRSTEHEGPYNPAYLETHKDSGGWAQICPYGQPGDRLWVRETWQETADQRPKYVYRADGEVIAQGWHWSPSIFMPRAASRITLEITAVRVERLQDISDADAVGEGYFFGADRCPDEFDPTGWYEGLWNDINGPGSWAVNPFVWVVGFRMIAQNIETQALISQAMTK